MRIDGFKVEEWMNTYEKQACYNIAETCVDSISTQDLFKLVGVDSIDFWKSFSIRRLTYGDIEGNPKFLNGVCRLYHNLKPDNIIPTHGAAGANSLIFSSLVEPGDHVVSIMPTYQQLYSIPKSLGAKVDILKLRREDEYLPNLDTLRKLVTPQTSIICINNPNNPTGALMDNNILAEIIEIAKSVDAYLICDEVYRHLTQADTYIESVADLYDKGISTSSMSKVFSMAGVRLGWIATRDAEVRRKCLSHRDYNTISIGIFDEELAAIALANADKLLNRSRLIVRNNLDILTKWVNNEPKISFIKPQGGTTALLHYTNDINSEELCKQLLEKTGTLLTPGDCFDEPKSLRIGYACKTEELKNGLEQLHNFMVTIS